MDAEQAIAATRAAVLEAAAKRVIASLREQPLTDTRTITITPEETDICTLKQQFAGLEGYAEFADRIKAIKITLVAVRTFGGALEVKAGNITYGDWQVATLLGIHNEDIMKAALAAAKTGTETQAIAELRAAIAKEIAAAIKRWTDLTVEMTPTEYKIEGAWKATTRCIRVNPAAPCIAVVTERYADLEGFRHFYDLIEKIEIEYCLSYTFARNESGDYYPARLTMSSPFTIDFGSQEVADRLGISYKEVQTALAEL